MQEHYMKLNKMPFEKIKSGEKVIEIRCNDEKRKKLRIGDVIIFSLVNGYETIKVQVEDLYHFSTFRELYLEFDFKEFGCEGYTMRQMLDETALIYSPDKERKYGALGIKISVVGAERENI